MLIVVIFYRQVKKLSQIRYLRCHIAWCPFPQSCKNRVSSLAIHTATASFDSTSEIKRHGLGEEQSVAITCCYDDELSKTDETKFYAELQEFY